MNFRNKIFRFFSRKKAKEILVFDTDMGTDDAAALLLLAKHCAVSPSYIVTVNGNVSACQALRNAVILRKYNGCDSSVIVKSANPGPSELSESGDFHGPDGLAGISGEMISSLGITDADFADHISFEDFADALSHADRITYIAVGPLTNLAVLIQNSRIRSLLNKIYIMGGGLNEFNCSHNAEFNFSKDPAAVQKVLSSGLDITLFPLDITNYHGLSGVQTDALEKTGSYPEYVRFFRYNLSSNAKYDGINSAVLHDCMPVLCYSDPSRFCIEDIRIKADEYGSISVCEDGVGVHVAKSAPDNILFNEFSSVFKGEKNA